MGSYSFLRKREDGDFDHVEVNETEGTETVFAKVLAADEQLSLGQTHR